jgi:hypothetical protein
MKRSRHHAKLLLALFAATATLGGGAGALSPAGAGAMIDNGNLTQAECFMASGIWDNIGERCEFTIGAGEGGGGAGGGPSYGGIGGGGGGFPGSTAPHDPWKALDDLAATEAKAAKDAVSAALQDAFNRFMERVEKRRQETCLRIKRAEVKAHKARGGNKAKQLKALRSEWLAAGCGP